MMWLYEGHMGDLFLVDHPLSSDERYCEACGDSDWEIGAVNNAEDVLRFLADGIAALPGDGGWDMDYIMEFLQDNFHVIPTKEVAVQLVLANRTNSQ